MNEISEIVIRVMSALGILRFSTGIIEKFSHFGAVKFLQNQIIKSSTKIKHKCVRVSGIIDEIGKLQNDRSYTTTSVHVSREISESGRTKIGASRAKTVGEDDYTITYIKIDGQRFSNVQFMDRDMWEAIEVGDNIEALIYIDGKGTESPTERDQLKKYAEQISDGFLGLAGSNGSKWMFLRNYTQEVQIEYPVEWMSGSYYAKVVGVSVGSGLIVAAPAMIISLSVPFIGFIIGIPLLIISVIYTLSLLDIYHRDMVNNLKIYHSIIDQTDN